MAIVFWMGSKGKEYELAAYMIWNILTGGLHARKYYITYVKYQKS